MTTPPAWTIKVPSTDVFCVVDLVELEAARAVFGHALTAPPRLGCVKDVARQFSHASWLTAASADGLLETGEVAVPALVEKRGAQARVALFQLRADGWDHFTEAEPGFRLQRVPFVADDGSMIRHMRGSIRSLHGERRSHPGGR